MGKAILLVRVSTERQEFDEQEKELYNMAIEDGYTDSEIIPVCEKESAIKLSENERKGLNRMKEIINQGCVTCVYAWEVSRIVRKKKVLFSTVDFLVNNKVQLIVKEPYIKLLNADRTINEGAETILTLFAQIAESEMRTKQARFHRTRVAYSKSGKWGGGHPVRFGYTLDENHSYIIDEGKAEIVRKAFEIYTTTNSGTTSVVRQLNKLGYKVTYSQISRVLTSEHYTGKLLRSKSHKQNEENGGWKQVEGLELRYPAIISEEVFAEAARRRASNNRLAYKRNSYYFGRGLARCATCGAMINASNANGWYTCPSHEMRYHQTAEERCKDNTTIGINALDTILWDAAVSEFIKANSIDAKTQKENAAKKIKDYKLIIENISARLEKEDAKLQRYSILWAEGQIDDDAYSKKKDQISAEKDSIRAESISAKEKITYYQKVIETAGSASVVDTLMSLAEEAFSITELRQMCEIVHTYINHIDLRQDTKRNKYVTIYAESGAVYKYRCRYGQRKHHYYREADTVIFQSLSPWVEFTPSIIIRRATGHLRKKMSKPFEIIKNASFDYNVQDSL